MGGKRALEQHLSKAERFAHPRIDLEQYATPADIAAHIIHFADVHGDIQDRIVVDLGSGPGIFAIGMAFRQPQRVVGIELDRAAITVAQANERAISPPQPIDWIRADATRAPLNQNDAMTVLMNPPFGAQQSNLHADRAFLQTAARIADVSYSLHNAGSRSFIDAFVTENEGHVDAAMQVSFDLTHQFDFHEEAETIVEAELYRVEWGTA